MKDEKEHEESWGRVWHFTFGNGLHISCSYSIGQNSATWLHLTGIRLINEILLCAHEEEGEIWWVSIYYHNVSILETIARHICIIFHWFWILYIWYVSIHTSLFYFPVICYLLIAFIFRSFSNNGNSQLLKWLLLHTNTSSILHNY